MLKIGKQCTCECRGVREISVSSTQLLRTKILLLKREREIERVKSPEGGEGASHMHIGEDFLLLFLCNDIIKNLLQVVEHIIFLLNSRSSHMLFPLPNNLPHLTLPCHTTPPHPIPPTTLPILASLLTPHFSIKS